MFAPIEGNEKHYIRITNIKDNSYYDNPCVDIRGGGLIAYRSEKSETGIREEAYYITIRVYGKLMGFVLNELSIGDQIFVIGHTGIVKSNGYPTRVTIAEQIYKSDWVNYFSFGFKKDYGVD